MDNDEFKQLMAAINGLTATLQDQVKAIDELVSIVDQELQLLKSELDDKTDDDDGFVTLMSGEKIKIK